jgi:hypothetical protein
MRAITNIIVHCSDSLWGCAREIRQWHLKRGFSDIGYHFVCLNGRPTFEHSKNALTIQSLDGSIECGRYLDDDKWIEDVEIGAHALGFNTSSIGVCLIGVNTFTVTQMCNTIHLLRDLVLHYEIPTAAVLGHCETESGKKEGKTCPNLDMNDLRFQLDQIRS